MVANHGAIVTSYNYHLENFMRSLVLESHVVSYNFFESFVHACLASLYFFAFVLASLMI